MFSHEKRHRIRGKFVPLPLSRILLENMPELHVRPISFALGIVSNMHFGSLHRVLAVISTDACSAHRLHIGSPASAKPIARAKAVWCMLNCNRPMCKYRARAGAENLMRTSRQAKFESSRSPIDALSERR